MRRALLTAGPGGTTLPAIGDPFMGGYYAGIIDTTKGNIIAADASQTGLRYALIVSPKTLEQTSKQYKTANSAAPAAASTRWDGRSATVAMATDTETYPAADYCYGLAYPADDASGWYLPAMDELELIYRNLKSTTENNDTSSRPAGTFPGVDARHGENISSDPTGADYEASVPARTAVAAFQAGGAQALGRQDQNDYYWTATEYTATWAWYQAQSGAVAGRQAGSSKTGSRWVRPVRRLPLAA